MAHRSTPPILPEITRYISTMPGSLIKLTLMVGRWGKSAPRAGKLTEAEIMALRAEADRRRACKVPGRTARPA